MIELNHEAAPLKSESSITEITEFDAEMLDLI